MKTWRVLLTRGPAIVAAALATGQGLAARQPPVPMLPAAPGHTAAGPGAALFSANCARCHGAHGQGGFGPDLRRLKLSQASVRNLIHDGVGDMPAFSPTLNNAQIDHLASFVLSLRGPASKGSAQAAEE